MNTTPSHPRLAGAVAEITGRYGIAPEGLTDAQVLSLGFDAACEDEDDERAGTYDQLITETSSKPEPASPAPVCIATWNETRSATEKPSQSALRVRVGAADAGIVRPVPGLPGRWFVQVSDPAIAPIPTKVCGSAADALTAVVLSPRACELGYRPASRMVFTLDASRVIQRGRA